MVHALSGVAVCTGDVGVVGCIRRDVGLLQRCGSALTFNHGGRLSKHFNIQAG